MNDDRRAWFADFLSNYLGTLAAVLTLFIVYAVFEVDMIGLGRKGR